MMNMGNVMNFAVHFIISSDQTFHYKFRSNLNLPSNLNKNTL